MNKHIFLFLFATPLLLFFGCREKQTVEQGSGTIVTEGVKVNDFDRIALSAPGTLTIKIGKTPSLQVTADDNILPLLVNKVENRTLQIGHPPSQSVILRPSEPIAYQATVKELNKVSLTGTGNIRSEERIEGSYLIVEVMGTGTVTLDISVEELTTNLMGEGKIVLAGNTDRQSINISGKGLYEGTGLSSATAEVIINGSGKAVVSVKDELDVSITGKGAVEYIGSPKVTTAVTGDGEIKQIGEAIPK